MTSRTIYRVQALLAEKDRLEAELKRLSGFGEPAPEDERVKRMYPVKVHTKDSRIEERRLVLRPARRGCAQRPQEEVGDVRARHARPSR